jgi:hypothetical protein
LARYSKSTDRFKKEIEAYPEPRLLLLGQVVMSASLWQQPLKKKSKGGNDNE